MHLVCTLLKKSCVLIAFPRLSSYQSPHLIIPKKLGIRKRVGKRIVRVFWGGNVLESAHSKPIFGGLRKWDLSGLCPFPLTRMTLREQTQGGGKSYHKWGVQNRFWGGISWYVFPSPEFPPPPFVSSLNEPLSDLTEIARKACL